MCRRNLVASVGWASAHHPKAWWAEAHPTGLLRVRGVELIHRGGNTFVDPRHDRIGGSIDRRIDRFALRRGEASQHILLAGNPWRRGIDPDPQPRILAGSEHTLDVFQSVVTTAASSGANP